MGDSAQMVARTPTPPRISFDIVPTEKGWRAANGNVIVEVESDERRIGQLVKRRAIKHATTPAAREEQWLRAELDGVRVFVKPGPGGLVEVVVTKAEHYP